VRGALTGRRFTVGGGGDRRVRIWGCQGGGVSTSGGWWDVGVVRRCAGWRGGLPGGVGGGGGGQEEEGNVGRRVKEEWWASGGRRMAGSRSPPYILD
jgi:hypothetical protein